MTRATPIESWEKKIREDYAGILSPEQIEATIIYWGDFIRTKLDEAYLEGYKKGTAEASQDVDNQMKVVYDEAYRKGREDTLEDMEKVMKEWYGSGPLMVEDYRARHAGEVTDKP